MVRAIAGRDDVRIGRSRELVDDDAVAALEPGGAASSTFGTMPMPMIATSHGNVRPSAVSTAVTRVVPCNALTAAPH